MPDQHSEEDRRRYHWETFRQLTQHAGSIIESRALDAQRLAAEFAKIGLQTAFILNGGALAAIPPNMPKLDSTAHPWAMRDAELFAWGLFAAAVSVFLAYINYTLLAQTYWSTAIIRDHELGKQFFPETHDTPTYVRAKKSEPKFRHLTNLTAQLAVIAVASSFALFVFGVIGFIDLAQHHMLSSP